MPRPIRIVEVRARERHQVGAAGGEDSVRIRVRRDRTHRHGGDPRFVPDAVREGGLEETPVTRTLFGHGLTRGRVDEIAAALLERLGDGHRLFGRDAAIHPVGRGDAHGERLLRGPGPADPVEHFERIAEAILQRSSVIVGAVVGEGGEKAREEISMGAVKFEKVEARLPRAPRGLGEMALDLRHVLGGHLAGSVLGLRPGNGRRRQQIPGFLGREGVVALPLQRGSALAARVAELNADLRPGVPVDELDDLLPGLDLLVVVEPGAAESDPAARRDVGHFRHHQARATDGPTGEVDQMPVVGHPVHRGILAHR